MKNYLIIAKNPNGKYIAHIETDNYDKAQQAEINFMKKGYKVNSHIKEK